MKTIKHAGCLECDFRNGTTHHFFDRVGIRLSRLDCSVRQDQTEATDTFVRASSLRFTCAVENQFLKGIRPRLRCFRTELALELTNVLVVTAEMLYDGFKHDFDMLRGIRAKL